MEKENQAFIPIYTMFNYPNTYSSGTRHESDSNGHRKIGNVYWVKETWDYVNSAGLGLCSAIVILNSLHCSFLFF